MLRVTWYFLVTVAALLFLLILWGVPIPAQDRLLPCSDEAQTHAPRTSVPGSATRLPRGYPDTGVTSARLAGSVPAGSWVQNSTNCLRVWICGLRNAGVLPRLLVSFLVALLVYYPSGRFFTWLMLVKSLSPRYVLCECLSPKVALFLRAGDCLQRLRGHEPSNGRGFTENVPLFPSQRAIIDALYSHVEDTLADRPGPLIGLKGDWGSGKSRILRTFKEIVDPRSPIRRMRLCSDVAVVSINVWECETSPDLHYDIVRKILSHPRILRQCISHYPPSFLFASLRQLFSRFLPDGMHLRLQFSAAAMDANLAVPLHCQNALRAVVKRWVGGNRRLVVVLEEIDRADSRMAQAALTLAKRALEMDGVTVILPYVQEQLLYKVFSPLHCYSPDLASSMLAVINDRHPKTLRDLGYENLPVVAQTFRSRKTACPAGSTGTNMPGAGVAQGTHNERILTLGQELDLALAATTLDSVPHQGPVNHEQNIMFALLSEKYLSIKIDVPGLTPADLCGMLASFPGLRAIFQKVAGTHREEITGAIVPAIARLRAGAHIFGDAPSIRHLEGHLVNYLTRLSVIHGDLNGITSNARQALVVSCVVLAYSSSVAMNVPAGNATQESQ